MKKTTFRLLMCLAVVSCGAPKVFATWPPSTSLENEPSSEAVEKIDLNSMTTHERFRYFVHKLEEDEKKLAEALKNLKKDEETLKNLSVASEKDDRTQSSINESSGTKLR